MQKDTHKDKCTKGYHDFGQITTESRMEVGQFETNTYMFYDNEKIYCSKCGDVKDL